MYYETRESRKKGVEPNRNNYIALSNYRLVLPASTPGAIRLEPLSRDVDERVWELKIVTGDDELVERPKWAHRFSMHGAKGVHASLTRDMSMSVIKIVCCTRLHNSFPLSNVSINLSSIDNIPFFLLFIFILFFCSF